MIGIGMYLFSGSPFGRGGSGPATKAEKPATVSPGGDAPRPAPREKPPLTATESFGDPNPVPPSARFGRFAPSP